MSVHRGLVVTVRHVIVGGLVCCCFAAAGCSFVAGGREPSVITSNDPASKIPAIKKATNARESKTAPQLVKALDSDDPAIRLFAIHGLQDMTGETFGYVWYAEEQERRESMDKWHRWLGQNAANGTLAGAGPLAK